MQEMVAVEPCHARPKDEDAIDLAPDVPFVEFDEPIESPADAHPSQDDLIFALGIFLAFFGTRFGYALETDRDGQRLCDANGDLRHRAR